MLQTRLKIKSYVAVQVRSREEISQVLFRRRGRDILVGLLVRASNFYKDKSTMECMRVNFALGRAWESEGEKARSLIEIAGLSNVAGRNRKMTTTHGGHMYYVIKVPKDTNDGNER